MVLRATTANSHTTTDAARENLEFDEWSGTLMKETNVRKNLGTPLLQAQEDIPEAQLRGRQTIEAADESGGWTLDRRNSVKRWALGVIGSVLMSAAGAAEMTLYEHAGFNGGQLTLRGYTANIASTGFNDRASSIVVSSGRWEVCTDADFKGYCATLTRGEYPTIDKRLSDRISSARETGSYGDNRGAYNIPERGSIELFGQPDFRGRTMRLEQDATTLQGTGFDDRASSVIVTAGTWQLCSDNGFAGNCRTFTPGRYADLGYGMVKEISSARLVRTVRDSTAVFSGGTAGGAPGAVAGPGRVILYREDGLNGDSVAVSGALVDLNRTSLGDDGASSVYVESGSWTLCTRPNFAGRCVVVGPGRYDHPGKAGLRQSVESVRPAATPAAPVRPAQREGLELFSQAGFAGDRLPFDHDIAALERSNFNDRTASVIIYSGQWEFCTDAHHRGNCTVFGPGSYTRIGGMTGLLSSVRRVQR